MRHFGEALQEALRKAGIQPPEQEATADTAGQPYDAEAEAERKWAEVERQVMLRAERYNAMAGKLHQEDGIECPECLNRGDFARPYKAATGVWYERMVRCRCMNTRESVARMKRSGLAPVMEAYTFEKYLATEPWQQRVRDTAMRYICDPGSKERGAPWFFIGGAIGCGKSHICSAIACKLMETYPVHYVLWVDEIAWLKANQFDDQYDTRMERLKATEVLYIDDLFKAGADRSGAVVMPSPADIQRTYEIINARYARRLRTIISSERLSSEIADIDQAIGGRILERAAGYTLNVGREQGRDYRIRLAGGTI